jgi:heme exporter protein C
MKQHWWKILSVVLMLYILVVGMVRPLSPGVMDCSPSDAMVGMPFRLHILGYNTDFLSENPRVWLKTNDGEYVKATTVGATDERSLDAHFHIKSDFKTKDRLVTATLVVDSKQTGTVVLPSAVTIKQRENRDASVSDNIEFAKPTDLKGDLTGANYPYRAILEESIRNLYYHVPLWFGMLIIFLISMIYSVLYLLKRNIVYDITAVALAKVGVLYGVLGTTTGMLWAQYTWGAAWSWDVKQNTTAISLLIYFAYFVLRSSFDEFDKQARISAVYNIFAFATLIPLLFVIPRLTESLHPGNGGNPAFSKMDLNSNMRLVFYPAVIGFTLFGLWIANVLRRIEIVAAKKADLIDIKTFKRTDVL